VVENISHTLRLDGAARAQKQAALYPPSYNISNFPDISILARRVEVEEAVGETISSPVWIPQEATRWRPHSRPLREVHGIPANSNAKWFERNYGVSLCSFCYSIHPSVPI
jgi:hypothetical protein